MAGTVHGQNLPEAVNLAALVAYPTFYAERAIVVRGQLSEAGGRLYFQDERGHKVVAAWRPASRPDGVVEATGQLWDLGRMNRDDPRLSGFDVAPIVKAAGEEWPRPGDVFVLAVTRSAPIETSAIATIRSIVLEGERASGRLITITGQFRGRNLFGDLPRSPGNSPSDFVLRASDAAIWVSGMAPKGKGFELNPANRIDTDRWLRVSGIVREARGLMWLEAKSIELAQRDAKETNAPSAAAVPVRAAPPPEVLFSVPVADESDVSPTTPIRIQLSRDLDPESLKNHVRVSYVSGPTAVAGAGPAPTATLALDEGGRVITLRFAEPLERFRVVRVELVEGIKGTDGQPLKPWSMTFTVGRQ